MSLSRCSAATLRVSAGVLGDVVELPAVAVEAAEHLGGDRRAEGGAPASAKEGPGQGQTARQPSWSMARWPNISKYWVRWSVAAAASSKVWRKLTPWIGDCVTPLIVVGGATPSASRMVGTMSMMWA